MADLIESVDSEELLRLIDARAVKLGVTQDVLLEVNIGGEAAKSGFDPAALPAALEFCGTLSAVRVRGLRRYRPRRPSPRVAAIFCGDARAFC